MVLSRNPIGVSHGSREFLQEYAVATIISEQLNNVDDGFRNRRYVTRADSLGATSEARCSGVKGCPRDSGDSSG